MSFFRSVYLVGVLLLFGCGPDYGPVTTGLDVLVNERIDLLAGKRVGIITNHTAISSSGEHIVDLLSAFPEVNITALFAPEHGIRGDRSGGEFIDTYVDSLTGITVFSLYQRNRKPTRAMLDSVDILVFDIQDIGARFYTYVSTMALSMEAAAENGIPFVVLDRPNPITGTIIEGPVLKKGLESFVGMFPIPIRHGLTVAELALMINGEEWLKDGIKADLTVIKAENWRRLQWFDQTGLPWVKTSPNMPTLDAATVYPGICLLEGVNLSEGRGTDTPFTLIGAPWMDVDTIIEELDGLKSYGLQFQKHDFTPVSMPDAAPNPEYQDELCRGFYLKVGQRNAFRPVSFAIHLLSALNKYQPNKLRFTRGFERLVGDPEIKDLILNGESSNRIIASWARELSEFKKLRRRYLLYD